MKRLFVVRHGNTFGAGEPPRRVGARTDLPLVESGREQASRLRAHFIEQAVRFDRVLTSPLRRTRETAEILVPGAVYEATEWLREIDHGPDEDQPEEAVIARIGTEALAAWERNATPPAGWTVDAEGRLGGWRALLADGREETVLLVTSNGAARFGLIAVGSQPAKLRTGAYGVIWGDPPAVSGWDIRP